MTGLTDNPYKPPVAHVEDLPATDSAAGPHPYVVRACALLWWSFVASLLGIALHEAFSSQAESIAARVTIATFGGAFSFLYVLWVTRKLKAGRNWMRWLFTLLDVGSMVIIALFWDFYKPRLLYLYVDNQGYGVVTGIQWLLHLVAAVLINTPGARAWFAAMKRP